MELLHNIFLFPYDAFMFMIKYLIAGFGWVGIFVCIHYLCTRADISYLKFRNPFYRD